MGNKQARPVPPRDKKPPEGVTRLCVVGFTMSHHTGRAKKVADAIVAAHPGRYEKWFYFCSTGFRGEESFLASIKPQLTQEQQEQFKDHKKSPFCFLEPHEGPLNALGGRDRFCEWALTQFTDAEKDKEIINLCSTGPSLSEAWGFADGANKEMEARQEI